MKLGFRLLIPALLVFSATSVRAAQDAALAARGRQAFLTQCYGCHTLGAAGTQGIAPDLSHIGAKYTEPELQAWLRDPSAQKPTAHMPKLTLSDQEIQALAAYLSQLR